MLDIVDIINMSTQRFNQQFPKTNYKIQKQLHKLFYAIEFERSKIQKQFNELF